MHTRFILLHTSHSGNVGAAARAMKVMGFDDLVLVQPRWDDVLQREEAIERASGADDILRKARRVDTWEEAVEGIEHLCATAMTPRDFGPPTFTPRDHLARLARRMHPPAPHWRPGQPSADEGRAALPQPLPQQRSVGFVFGSERYGMRNEDVYRCHVCLSIPTDPAYGSLNLAAAVQVIAYEWRQAIGGFHVAQTPSVQAAHLADAAQIEGMLAHWQQALEDVGYLDPAAPKKLMPRLRQMWLRTDLHDEEIHILRGIAKAMQRTARQAKGN